MNIEEAIKILKELKKNEWGELLNCWDYGAEESKAIETLLTAYEKEKEKNKNAKERIEYYLVGNFALNNFDERNKELRKIEKILGE